MQEPSPERNNPVVPLSSGPSDFVRRNTASPIARIHLLGTMRASTIRLSDVLPRGRKARAILGCLCLAGDAPVERARLVSLLWDRVSTIKARASLRQAFRELTLAFGPFAGELLSIDRDTIRFNTGACWIDAVALLSEQPGGDNVRGKLAELCRGELLEDLDGVSTAFDRWLLTERARFAERLRNLLASKLNETEKVNALLSEREAIASRLIAFDPTHEGASRILMRALADRRERVQALMEYQRLRGVLEKALDAAPSPRTRALYEAIRMSGSNDAQGGQPVEPNEQADNVDKSEARAPKRGHRRVGVIPFVPILAAVGENLAFSIAQEVAAALARFRWFDVVAPTALMRGLAPTFLGDLELRRQDLDYVVDGSVSCSGGMYRINVRLLDLTTDATPVWTGTFDLPTDRLDLLDHVTASIVAQIDPIVLYIEGPPKKRCADDDALGCVMRAPPLLNTMERPGYEAAGRLIDRALTLEPDNAAVLSWAAYWGVYYVGQGWADDPDNLSRTALEYAQRATQLDPSNAEALAVYGHLLSFLHKDVGMALHYFDRALRLNRNLPFIWVYSAVSSCYGGDPDTALQRLRRCRELTASQRYFSLRENPIAIAYLMKRQYREAAEIGRRVVQCTPAYVNGYKPLIAALGHLRRRKEAKPLVDKLLEFEPGFTVKRFGQVYPFTQQRDLEHYMEGLLRAGVPEG